LRGTEAFADGWSDEECANLARMRTKLRKGGDVVFVLPFFLSLPLLPLRNTPSFGSTKCPQHIDAANHLGYVGCLYRSRFDPNEWVCVSSAYLEEAAFMYIDLPRISLSFQA
jgi:hypothetical protein